jgi:DNA repair protein RadC
MSKGPHRLSDAELIAILLGNGHANQTALDLSRSLLLACANNIEALGKKTIAELTETKGIGPAKAVTVLAAIELGRRRHAAPLQQQLTIRSSEEMAGMLRSRFKDLSYEIFAVVYLNQANRVLTTEVISEGGITGTVADPRMILKRALEKQSTSVVLCHNHPSGNRMPSEADKVMTLKIKQAAAYLDIRVLDHIIVSDDGYFSFADEGLL